MQRLQKLLPFLTLVVLAIALTIATPNFLTQTNLASVARQTAVINIMALGMTLVIITAGIDLSVGSILAIAGLLGATAKAMAEQDEGDIALPPREIPGQPFPIGKASIGVQQGTVVDGHGPRRGGDSQYDERRRRGVKKAMHHAITRELTPWRWSAAEARARCRPYGP